MHNENIVLQAKVFLYHLNKSNTENGLRKDEALTLRQVNENTKSEIERDYNPTMMTKIDPGSMEAFSYSVLKNLGSQPKLQLATSSIERTAGANYLVAFSQSG
ncbi:MAG: hypothetical protein EOO86_07950 [Pedobacter sp.]|nr:MAG: hypothetical protein EOO86_07950 [Pedobacter sp.]